MTLNEHSLFGTVIGLCWSHGEAMLKPAVVCAERFLRKHFGDAIHAGHADHKWGFTVDELILDAVNGDCVFLSCIKGSMAG